MATFSFELVSPERLVFSGQVTEVIVPGSEGEFGVTAGHAPFISTLSAGILTVKGDGADKRLFVRGGFAEANPAGLTVLAEQATPVEAFDRAALQQLIKDAQEDVADARSDESRQKAERNLADLQQVAAILDLGAAPAAH